MLRNNLMLPTEALDIPEAIDFDGTNDYLSRASDLTGNADGKTFTFSAWIYLTSDTHRIYDTSNSGTNTLGIWFAISSQGFAARAFNASGTSILLAQSNPSGVLIPVRTWTHILFSVDLTNTSNRHFYVNDVLQPIAWVTYTNDTIDFTRSAHGVGAYSDGVLKSLQRISHLYLDYTYRDLSVEANRRLFITADRKPALNQQALNPILYLPLNDPTQPGKNLGTGGDFNLTGVVARSGRGPNQFNAPYSGLDGVADYLNRSFITGINSGKVFTFSFSMKTGPTLVASTLLEIGSGTTTPTFTVYTGISGSNANLRISGKTPNGVSTVVSASTDYIISPNRNYTVVMSFDTTSQAGSKVFVNGVDSVTSWSSTGGDIGFEPTASPRYIWIASGIDATKKLKGSLGNVFFNTSYIDLSVPANLAKFVTGTGIDAKPADLGANGELPFGTPPLIYLPMYGNNAGKNYGTGGDFTVNSGPFTGARGPNEFWGNKAAAAAGTNYIYKSSALVGVAAGKTFSASFNLLPSDSGVVRDVFSINTSGKSLRLIFQRNSSNGLTVFARDAASATIFNVSVGSTLTAGSANSIQVCVNGVSGASYIAINGVAIAAGIGTFATNILLNEAYISLFESISGSTFTGSISEFYFTTEYIDFSQEANRLKFRDAFGNPVALQPQIEAGTLPNPAIYMRFDPANFGKNYGTGGDFTVNGIITDGGQL